MSIVKWSITIFNYICMIKIYILTYLSDKVGFFPTINLFFYSLYIINTMNKLKKLKYNKKDVIISVQKLKRVVQTTVI